jgi:hypothetical protein
MLAGNDGASLNGPSLIRMPAWVENPLGRYYLYFAHHAGKYIRMAYADRLEGENSADPEAKTSAAVSKDGIHFVATGAIRAPAYLRVFRRDGAWYGLAGRGILLRAAGLGERFEPVAEVVGREIEDLVDPAKLGEPGARSGAPKSGPDRCSIRHVGVDIEGDLLWVYFSCVGHRPERILATSIRMTGDPARWKAAGVVEVLRPEIAWEGAKLPLAYSKGGRSWEHGLAIAELRYAPR